jgi:hypothetical protein
MCTRQLLLAACWLMIGRAMAAEYYVSPHGKDAHAGSQAAPWQTLARASAVAAPGDNRRNSAQARANRVAPIEREIQRRGCRLPRGSREVSYATAKTHFDVDNLRLERLP